MIGRKKEIDVLKRALESDKSSFIAVAGRRRIGKTYLIDQTLMKYICFRLTGIQHGSLQTQLQNFAYKLSEASNTPFVSVPQNWQDAFHQLRMYLSSMKKNRKHVIFIDELPWVYTKRSGFLQLLAHLWNDYLSKHKHFILVICGSSTSWIFKNIVHDKGGLHNRLSDIIQLQAFSLSEVREFLNSKQIRLSEQEIVKIYMTMGGVPFYLEQIRRGESATKIIERLCFESGGLLKNEYDNLYRALFENASNHEAIVATLAKSHRPLSRKEIIKRSKVQSGGPYNRCMQDLLLCGFIKEADHFGRKTRGAYFRLSDEYSKFYHCFIRSQKKFQTGYWSGLSMTQQYRIWTGYAFESLCFKHIDKIKSALGIAAVNTNISALNVKGDDDQEGLQIDLIIDRQDNTINLCELKFYSGPYTITKDYAKRLVKRKQLFVDYTGTKKQLFLTFITNHGLLKNAHYLEVVDSELTIDDLF